MGYRDELTLSLMGLLTHQQKLTGPLAPSVPISDDGVVGGDTEKEKLQLLRWYQEGWAALSSEKRQDIWDEAQTDLDTAVLVEWWAKMDEATKIGLAAPGVTGDL